MALDPGITGVLTASPSLHTSIYGQPRPAEQTPPPQYSQRQPNHVSSIHHPTHLRSLQKTLAALPFSQTNQLSNNMRSVVTLLSSLAVTLHLASALPSHPAPLMQRYTLYFGSQCRYPTLGGDGVPGQTTLGAQCLDGLGVFWDTSLNLNLCLGDNDGELVYQNE